MVAGFEPRLEIQFEGHSHVSYLNEHLLNTHPVPGTMLDTAEFKEKLLPCWQLIAPSTLSSFHWSNSTHSTRRPQPRQPVRPWEPCMALRKGKQAQALHPGIAQGCSQQQSIPKEPQEIPNFSASTPSLFLTKASSKK